MVRNLGQIKPNIPVPFSYFSSLFMVEEFQKREVLFLQKNELEFKNPANKKEAQDEYEIQIHRYNNK